MNSRQPSANATPDLPGLALSFPASVIPTGRADGGVLVIPGRPVLHEAEVTTAEAVRLIGGRYSRAHVRRLFSGRNRRRGCKIMIPVRELLALTARK